MNETGRAVSPRAADRGGFTVKPLDPGSFHAASHIAAAATKPRENHNMPFRLTIARRLWLWAAFATAIFYCAAGLGWLGLAAARDSLQSVHDGSLVPVMKVIRFRELLNANRVELLLALQHDPRGPLLSAHDHAVDVHLEHIESNAAEQERLLDDFRDLLGTERERQIYGEFETGLGAWSAKQREAVAALKAGDYGPPVVSAILAAGRIELKAAFDALQALAEWQVQEARQEYHAAESRYTTTRAILVGLILLAAIVGTLTGILSMRRLNGGLAEANRAARAIAAGDLSRPVPVSGQDEITEVLRQMGMMRDNLHEIVAAIRHETGRLNAQSGELDRSASASAAVAGKQSEAAASMAAAVEQLSVSIDQVETHANEVNRVTQDSARQSDASAAVIKGAAEEIHRIAQAVTATAGDIRSLEEMSGQITGIVNVIREIADQTNLLALNAAIEAARAGEQGRGFAVVADEVRKLAERTATSTGEIAAMIGRIQEESRAAVAGMEASVARVRDGVRLAGEAGASIEHIRDSAGGVTQAVDSIGLTLKEQASAARDIAARVEHVSQGTEELAAGAKQTAAAASELAQVAMTMEQLAGCFRLASPAHCPAGGDCGA